MLEEALNIANKLDVKAEIGTTLSDLGRTCNAMGRHTQATDAYQKALLLAKEINDSQRVASLSGDVAWLGRRQDMQTTGQYLEQALKVARETGNREEEAIQLGRLGILMMEMGQTIEGISYLKLALEIAEEIKDRHLQRVWRSYLGRMYAQLGQFHKALQLHEADQRIAREIAERRGEGASLQAQGEVYFALGQFDKARLLYEKALTIAQETYALSHASQCYGQLGEVYGALGKPENAKTSFNEALDLAYKCGVIREQSRHLLGLSRVWLEEENVSAASECCSEVLSLAISEYKPRLAFMQGLVLLWQGNVELAQAMFGESVTLGLSVIKKEEQVYTPHYLLATALVGQAICDPRWADPPQRPDLLAPALTEYRHALAITSAPGIVRDALRDLELIRAAGIEGLEPVFALLEGALAAWKPPTDDDDSSPLTLPQEDTL